MQDKIREIRSSLRLVMNGVTSGLMREKGIEHKLNFGVEIPRLRRMAEKYAPDQALAEALWQENVRELKILATLIYPPEKFYLADDWVSAIADQELAGQASMNLFSIMPSAKEHALRWIQEEPLYTKLSGFLTIARWMMRGGILTDEETRLLSDASVQAFYGDSHLLKNTVLNTLLRLIQQGEEQKERVFDYLSDKNELSELLFR